MGIRARALKDNIEGWASVASNFGKPYLEEQIKNIYKVTSPTALAKDPTSEEVVRGLELGEVLEMLDFSRSADTPVHMKVVALKDGASGWVRLYVDEKLVLETM